MKKTAPRGSVKDGKDRASRIYIFGPVQWRSRASWKQRAGWIFDSHMARSFLRISIWRVKNPSGAVPKSIWRVSFSGDFIVGSIVFQYVVDPYLLDPLLLDSLSLDLNPLLLDLW